VHPECLDDGAASRPRHQASEDRLRLQHYSDVATPLRLAEDYATADILTGGRIIFGVGRGYHTREVETFGSPLLDQQANRELFEEQVDIIFRAFTRRSFSPSRQILHFAAGGSVSRLRAEGS